MRAWPAALAAVALGCSAPPSPAPGASPSDAPPKETRLATGKVEVEAKADDGTPGFVVRAQSSNIAVAEDSASTGMEVVEGEIYQAGKVAARFKGASGFADQSEKTLSVRGSVEVRDVARGLVLRAEEVRYREGSGRLEAKGAVTVSSEAWKMGPFAELWATPDLARVGTPDRFR